MLPAAISSSSTAPTAIVRSAAPIVRPDIPQLGGHEAKLSPHAWAIARAIAKRFHEYAVAHPETVRQKPHSRSDQSAVKPSITSSAPVSPTVSEYRAIGARMHARMLQAEHSAAYRHYAAYGKRLSHWVSQYHPYVTVKNGKYVLRTTVNGVPVIPPGMTGAELQQFLDHKAVAIQNRTATTMVFISLSMPKSVLRRMFADDWDNKYLRTHTVFVLRGWPAQPDGLEVLFSKLIRLFPSPIKQPTVEVDPVLFTGHHVTRVPVVLHEIPHTHQWNAIVGDGYGLDAAIQRINHGKGSPHKVFGRTWKIAEPNLIHVIDRRIKHYNWKAAEERARNRNLVAMSRTLAVDLPESRRPLNYYWDPAVVAQHTMTLPDGQVLAKAGERINPLRYFPAAIRQTFVVFNPKKRWQVQDVEAWLSTYRNVVLMVTRLPENTHRMKALDTKLHHFVFASSPLLLSRLGVSRSPSLITIDRYRLHIQVPAIPRFAPPAGGA